MDLILRLAYFVTSFAALSYLLRWLRMRDDGPQRLSRGLRIYVGGTDDRI